MLGLMTNSVDVPIKANAKASSLNLKSNKPDNLVVLERTLSFVNFLQGDETSPVSRGPGGNSAKLVTNFVDVPNKANTNTSSLNLKSNKPDNLVVLKRTASFTNFLQGDEASALSKGPRGNVVSDSKPSLSLSILQPEILFSPRPINELNEAAVKVQKVYKSYRTRRNLADCAVVVEELWWKAIDFATLKHSSVSFYKNDKPETVGSRWARARTRVAKVGKGLSKDEKAQKLALQHWLEAIDPRHRYGHNLHLYYDVWFESESTQPFFYWLDVGQGKDINLAKCPRSPLQKQCIKYLGPSEREVYEVVIQDGKLIYKLSGLPVNTMEGSKWIFVLSTTRAFYVGEKKKGVFQHSSFLSGAAITAAGRLVSRDGVLKAIWPYSGHYHPTEENFREFISFLEEHQVDLSNVERCAVDDDYPSYASSGGESNRGAASVAGIAVAALVDERRKRKVDAAAVEATSRGDEIRRQRSDGGDTAAFELARGLSCRWTTGTGPRIGCVRDYPMELQSRALEQVNLSPRVAQGPFGSYGPIPSPRPSPNYRVSPRLSYMGLPSPNKHVSKAG